MIRQALEQSGLASMLPGLLAALIMLIAWWPWRRTKPAEPLAGGAWAGALTCGGAVLGSLLVIDGWPGIPPKHWWLWLAPIIAVATVLGFVAGLLRRSKMTAAAAGLLAAIAAGALLHPPASIESPWLWRGALALAAIILWLLIEPLASRRSGASMPLGLCVVFGGDAFVIMQAGYASPALVGGAASAALGFTTIVAWCNPRLSLARGATPVVAVLLPTLLMEGWHSVGSYTDVPVAAFILAGVAPLALWIGQIPPLRRLEPWKSLACQIAAVSIPLAVAAILSILPSLGEDPYAY